MSLHTGRADPPRRSIGGRYELVRELGRGGFGRTFLAHDATSDHPVAIKVLEGRSANWKARELFEREGAVLRSLRHRGIPQVHDVFRDEWEGVSSAFLVMEYVEGTSLARLIAEQRQLAPAEVLHIFLALLDILDYLHGRIPPVLHRDIKPSNVILRPDGTPALVDFGGVRRVFMGAEEPGSTIVGTYGYMPYEQYMGRASPASDLYALGATFLHLLTGRAPREFMNADGRLEVPRQLPGDARLVPVIARLLRPSPAERFASAREAREALLSPPSAMTRAAPGATALALLPSAPRRIEGPAAALLDRAAPSAWALMDTSAKGGDEVGVGDVLLLVFFSVLTAGVLPLVFLAMARARRRRLRRFFEEGTRATAEILGIGEEKIPFNQRLARVTYEFEADGQLHRDVDQILPAIADRWRVGDRVEILYVAERGYDSVIVAAG